MINNQRGFTIIESLVAFTILTLALSPMLLVVTTSSRIASSIKNNLAASMLAQEGIEVVRAIRDTNWLNSRAFYVGLNDESIGTTNSGRVQYNTIDELLPEDAGAKLYLNSVSGLYSYDNDPSSSPSFFYRSIYITKVSDVELKIVSEITWREPARPRVISVESRLFDWK